MGAHDKAFRRLMKEKGAAEALLRERLPAALVRRLAGPPESISESFVDDGLKASFVDVLLRVPLLGGAAFVFCLVEHKRTETAFALVQVLKYLAAVYAHLAPAHKKGPLPTVVPMLIYNGESRWKGPRRFSELLDEGLRRFSVDFKVVLIDLGAEPVRSLSSNPILRGGLLALKAAATRRDRFEPVVKQMLGTLDNERSTLLFFLRYLEAVSGRRTLRLVERVAEQQQGKEKMMQTVGDYIESRGFRRGMRRGLKKGIEKGIEKGLEKGREEGLRDSIRFIITKRFKRMTRSAEQHLVSADPAALPALLDRAVTARSLRSVFTEH